MLVRFARPDRAALELLSSSACGPSLKVKRIFISYRRDDTQDITGRLYDWLEAKYGREGVFMDIDNIPLGANFRERIEQSLADTDIVIAMIGPRWLEAIQARANEASDFVRIELETAYRIGARIVPVLINDTKIPSENDLPTSLKTMKLSEINAPQLRSGRDFREDRRRLIRGIERIRVEIEAERKAAEEAERKRKAKARRKAAAEAEKKRKAKAERKAAAEAERQRKAAELAEQQRKEEAQRKAAQETPAARVEQTGREQPVSLESAQETAADGASTAEQPEPWIELAADRRVGVTPGKVFRDELASEGNGPEMVAIHTGVFCMGSREREPGRAVDERPLHEVSIAAEFALGRFPVTFAEYDRYCSACACTLPYDQGWGRGRRPAVNVSWKEALAYCAWLSQETGQSYRLPSEAMWEYACRAGTITQRWWGDEAGADLANFVGSRCQWSGTRTSPVNAFKPNQFGLYDMLGNVWEWAQDCWHGSYDGAPPDGSAWEEGGGGDCTQRVVRGGSWSVDAKLVHSASRDRNYAGATFANVGFRVARAL